MSGNAPEVLCITTGAFIQNSWLVWDAASRDAVLVDAGEGHEEILAEVAARNLVVRGIWLTHAHIDHVLGLTALRRATGAPVWLHPDDLRWYNVLPEQGRMFGVDGLERLAPPEHALQAGQQLQVGQYTFEVRHVPGHSPGHVAFLGYGLALSGDVLFEDSIGRTDLAGGSLPTLIDSIRRELLTLPDATRVLPGHGAETTIGRERSHNPFLLGN